MKYQKVKLMSILEGMCQLKGMWTCSGTNIKGFFVAVNKAKWAEAVFEVLDLMEILERKFGRQFSYESEPKPLNSAGWRSNINLPKHFQLVAHIRTVRH